VSEAGAPAGYRYFDVEADVGVTAWGPTLADAFAQAALGVLALIVAPDAVQARQTRDVRAQGESVEELLVNWINECLYVHELEGFVARRVEVTALEGNRRVHGQLHGEELDTRRHRLGTVVKAATFHRVAVREADAGAEVSLIVDV
jgi:SHS2 domain-containing protein